MTKMIDAIPVEWLQDKMDEAYDRGDGENYDAIERLLRMWRKEQEAR